MTSGVDPRLAGRRFNDRSVVGQPALACSQADEILASTSDGPTWVRRSGKGPNFYGSSIPLGDLGPGESIRDYLRFDRFSSLLPLTHLLDEVTRELGWTPPPLRASFIIDDPNLHWPTYGYVRFKELARHAQAHGYHVAMAAIPLDLWYFDRRAARIFHENHEASVAGRARERPCPRRARSPPVGARVTFASIPGTAESRCVRTAVRARDCAGDRPTSRGLQRRHVRGPGSHGVRRHCMVTEAQVRDQRLGGWGVLTRRSPLSSQASSHRLGRPPVSCISQSANRSRGPSHGSR